MAEQPPVMPIRAPSMCAATGDRSAAPATIAPTRNTYMSERAAIARSARSRFCGPPGARRPRRSRIGGSNATAISYRHTARKLARAPAARPCGSYLGAASQATLPDAHLVGLPSGKVSLLVILKSPETVRLPSLRLKTPCIVTSLSDWPPPRIGSL